VSKLPDVNNLLSAQADTMNAAQAAGQVVAQGIGAYADMKRDQASDEATAASWDEGGTDRVALHVVGGALIGGLGGGGIGSAAAGAAGAGFASAFAGKLNGLADQIGDATGSMTLGNVVSNVLAGAGGALVGGSAGAFTASNADLYNRSTGNADGKGGTGNPFGIGKDLVSTVCGAGAQCSDATLNAAIQAQGANAAVASQNVAIYGPAAVGTAAAVALAPEALAGLALIPGAPIFSSGGALGSAALASPVGTGVISAGINAGSQYIQNGSINPIDVAGAFSTGVAGSYGGLLWNVGVNAFGGATTTALNNILQGKNDSVIGAGITSGVFSSVGYSAGSVTANTINSIMRPTVNNAGSWAGSGVWSGSGYNLFNPNNTAVIGGGFTGGTLQEIVQGAINGAQQAGNKK
jgi:filamentous hemagglutinin